MKDDFDLVFAEGALNQIAIDDVAADARNLFNAPAAYEFALRNPIAHQAYHIRSGLKKLLYEPRSKQSGATCDQNRAIFPK
jgi:hypothetical protein